jgi:hypothetical protein
MASSRSFWLLELLREDFFLRPLFTENRDFMGDFDLIGDFDCFGDLFLPDSHMRSLTCFSSLCSFSSITFSEGLSTVYLPNDIPALGGGDYSLLFA